MESIKLSLKILSYQLLPEIPSASGIIKHDQYFYGIGDDSPFLFQLDLDFKVVSKTLIHSTEKLQGNNIPKFHKPDFEAMEMISENEILIFGSGSKSPERDVCVWMELGKEIQHKEFDISLFYDSIRNLDVLKGFELDIEGLAQRDGILYLFNRGRNIVFIFSLEEFKKYLKAGEDFPIPDSKTFNLPKIGNLEAGFSGASSLGDLPYLIFTAAVEDSPNAYDDGEIMGSFLGLIGIQDGNLSEVLAIQEIIHNDLKLKVESVIVHKVISDSEFELVLVTDNDGEPSEVLTCYLEFGTWSR